MSDPLTGRPLFHNQVPAESGITLDGLKVWQLREILRQCDPNAEVYVPRLDTPGLHTSLVNIQARQEVYLTGNDSQ